MCLTISSKHIYGDGISSVAGIRSVSLALNEIKTIRYYINTSGSSSLRAEPVNGTADSHQNYLPSHYLLQGIQ